MFKHHVAFKLSREGYVSMFMPQSGLHTWEQTRFLKSLIRSGLRPTPQFLTGARIYRIAQIFRGIQISRILRI